jgi:hypothetical protein
VEAKFFGLVGTRLPAVHALGIFVAGVRTRHHLKYIVNHVEKIALMEADNRVGWPELFNRPSDRYVPCEIDRKLCAGH